MKGFLYTAVLTLLLTQSHSVYADSFTRTPSSAGTYQEMSFNVTIDDVSSCSANWSIFGVQFDPVFAEFSLGENVLITENTHIFNTQFSSTYNVQQITAGCDGSGGSLASLEFDGFNNLFTIEPYVAPTTTPTVAGAFSFVDFNDVSPTDMVASVREGTVETTGKTLPLLVLLGIPLAFTVLIMLSKLISDTVKPETKSNKAPWSAHGSMEHELTAFRKKQRSRIKRDL